jgi:hypothetical protein
VPAPMIGLSPTRPGNFPVMPPVEVAAARSPMAVAGNRTHRPVPALLVVSLGKAASAAFEFDLQRAPALFGEEIGGFGEGDTVLAAKRQRALANQEHTSRMFHDRARCQNRVARSEDAGHRTCATIATVHYRRVHFLGAGRRKHAASPGVEQRNIFEHNHRPGHGIKGAIPAREDIAADRQRAVQSLMIETCTRCRRLVAMDRPDAPMNR